MCTKHIEAWNKIIVKQNFYASVWLITELKTHRLFNNTSSESEYVVSMEMVINESLIWECVKLIERGPALGFYPVICLCWLRQTAIHFSHYSRSRVRDLNPVSL